MGFFRTDKPSSVCWQKVKQRLRQATEAGRRWINGAGSWRRQEVLKEAPPYTYTHTVLWQLLIYRKVAKILQKVRLYSPPPPSFSTTVHIPRVQLSQSRNQHCYLPLIKRDFLRFHLFFRSCHPSGPGSHPRYQVMGVQSPLSPLVCDSVSLSSSSSFFMTLTVLRCSGQVFCWVCLVFLSWPILLENEHSWRNKEISNKTMEKIILLPQSIKCVGLFLA